MKRKVIPLIVAIAGLTLLFAGAGFAEVPAPPVNQTIGFDDKEFEAFAEGDCRACHVGDPGIPDRHHMLYGSVIPDPSVVPYPKGGDNETDTNYGCLNCHAQDTTGGVTSFLVERDCTVCHTETPHHVTADAIAGDCVSCHGDVVDNMSDNHTIPTYTPSLVTPSPSAYVMLCELTGDPCGDDSDCTSDVCEEKGIACTDNATCAVSICEDSKNTCTDNYDCDPGYCRDNDTIACSYDTDCPPGAGSCRSEEECLTGADVCIVDAEACVASDTAKVGGCNYCHDAGPDNSTGVVIDVVDNSDTHHSTGLTGDYPTGCLKCHQTYPISYDEYDIRTCEGCHGYESLHNIQADSDDNGTDIVVGGEDPGYGHVGKDGGFDSDCWGCHGFSIASAPSSGPIVPTINSIDPAVIAAGTDTQITLSGAAFTNVAGVTEYTSNVELAGSPLLTPDAISVSSMTVTIPGTVSAGVYEVRAVKDGVKSNPAVIVIKPAVVISSTRCGGCTGVVTINGSGFGDAPPEGAEEYLNVMADGLFVGTIISWTDTQIQVEGGCSYDFLTVNALMGSATK